MAPSLIGRLLLISLLAGCTIPICDPEDPKFGKDCYECTRQAAIEAGQADPHTGRAIDQKMRTEQCLKSRGYVRE